MRTPRCDLPRLRGSFLWSVPSGTLTRQLGYARTYGRERKDPQSPTPAGLRPPRAGRERQAILDTLEVTHGKLAETARRLGISRTTLWRRLRAYGLRPNGQGNGPATRV